MEVYVHSKNDLKRYVILFLFCLIPFYLYGLYKNGYLLYTRDLISIFSSFKLLYLLVINLIIYFGIKRKINYDLLFLSMFVIPLFVSFNINYIYYIGCIFLYVFLSKYYENISLVILVLSLFYNFANKMEVLNNFEYSIIDILFGRNISGMGTSNIILCLVLFLGLCFSSIYKRDVSISSLITFLILSLLFDKSLLLIGNIYFNIVIIASWSLICPLSRKGQIIDGVFVGVLGFLFTKFINPYYGMTMAIALVSCFYDLFLLKFKKVFKNMIKKFAKCLKK